MAPKKTKVQFRPSWTLETDTNGYPRSEWLRRHDEENAFCKVCETTIKFSVLGGQAISHHAKTSKHAEKCRQVLDTSQLRLERGRPTQPASAGASAVSSPSASNSVLADTTPLAPVLLYSVRRKSVSAEIFWALKVVASDYSAASCDGVKNVFEAMFEGASQLENFSLNRTKFGYVLTDGLAPYFRDKLKADLSGAYYSLYFDETTNDGGSKELRTGVQYWSKEENRIVSSYLRTYFIGSATGEVLSEKILSAIDEHDLPLNKLLMLGRDGPAVNDKVQRLINEKVKTVRQKSLLDIGSCNIHIAHNAFEAGLDAFGDSMADFVTLVYNFFHGFPSRWEDFEKCQAELGLKHQRFIKHVDSRWLTLGPAVDRTLEQLKALDKYFLEFIPSKKPKFLVKVGYKKIKAYLTSPTIRAELVFVRDSAQIFSQFTGFFQKKEPLIHVLHSVLRTVALTLLNKVCEPKVVKKKGVCLSALVRKNLLAVEKVDVGANVEVELQAAKINEKAVLVFRRNARDHFVAAARHLLDKSALKSGSNVRYYRCLQPQERLSERSCSDIVTVARHLPAIVDLSKLVDEWKLLQFEKDEPGSADGPIDVYWSQFFKKKKPIGNDLKYPNVTAVVQPALSLIHGQGDVERGFSESGRTLTPDRASMKERTLDAYMITKNALRKFNNQPHLVPITKELVVSVEGARAKYETYLDAEKKKKEKEAKDKEDEERRKAEEEERQAELRRARKRISDEEEKLKEEKTKEAKQRKTGQKLLEEGSERLKVAIDQNDLEEASVAQALIEAAKKVQSEAELKRKEVSSLQKTIDEKKSRLITRCISREKKK